MWKWHHLKQPQILYLEYRCFKEWLVWRKPSGQWSIPIAAIPAELNGCRILEVPLVGTRGSNLELIGE